MASQSDHAGAAAIGHVPQGVGQPSYNSVTHPSEQSINVSPSHLSLWVSTSVALPAHD